MPQFFIDRPVFAWVVALFILLAGALAIPQLPVAQYPDVAPPQIEIYAVYPGASAQTVDESVVSLIEEELNGADHLLYFESQSSLGSATIKATFQPGTDPEMAQVDVQNRLKVVESRLPQAVIQQGLQVEKVSAGFLLLVTLTSSDGKLDDVALSDYLARNVMNEIKRLDGVGKAQLYGAERAMRIWIDPQKLIGFNLTPADVNAAIVAHERQAVDRCQRATGAGGQCTEHRHAGAGEDGRTVALLPGRRGIQNPLRHFALRQSLDHQSGLYPWRGHASGVCGDVPVPAKHPLHADPDAGGSGRTDGNLRDHVGAGVLDQRADHVRHGAGHRYFGGRRHCGGGERRAHHGH
jgi:hypothetical protein